MVARTGARYAPCVLRQWPVSTAAGSRVLLLLLTGVDLAAVRRIHANLFATRYQHDWPPRSRLVEHTP